MPFGFGAVEVIAILVLLALGAGVIAGAAYLVSRGSRNQQLEDRVRDLERRLEEREHREQLPGR